MSMKGREWSFDGGISQSWYAALCRRFGLDGRYSGACVERFVSYSTMRAGLMDEKAPSPAGAALSCIRSFADGCQERFWASASGVRQPSQPVLSSQGRVRLSR